MMLDSLSPLGGTSPKPASLAGIKGAVARERCDIGAVLITTTVTSSEATEQLELALDCSLPKAHGLTVQANGKRAIWLSPRSWILLCAPADETRLINAVAHSFPDYSVHASRFSDALGWLSLEGEAVEDLLHQGSFVSFDQAGLTPDQAKRTLLAGIPAIILRESSTLWIVGVERSRTRFLVEWLSGLTQSVGENP